MRYFRIQIITSHILYIQLLLLLHIPISFAEIITDGSLGAPVHLTGPAFEIPANLGQQIDQRLFHSFSHFNLAAGESANFSGSAAIQAIFARVTGGEVSNINGLLSSSIPTADLYLLNPAGIVFHENARLDVQGSFYASTADVVQFADGTEFRADAAHAAPLLSTAPVEQFGFLSDKPADIEVHHSNLSVPTGETLALIGGDITLLGAFQYDADGNLLLNKTVPQGIIYPLLIPESNTQLKASSGNILLFSRGESGAININATDMASLMEYAAQGGAITLDRFYVITSGQDGGHIALAAKDIQQQESYLQTIGWGGEGGYVQVAADTYQLQGDEVHSSIHAHTKDSQTGSNIDIQARQLSAQGGVSILNSTTTQYGNINIKVAEDLYLEGGLTPDDSINGIISVNEQLEILPTELYNKGYITVEAGNLYLLNGAEIAGFSFGAAEAPSIIINIENEIIINGALYAPVYFTDSLIFNSGILSNSYVGAQLMQLAGFDINAITDPELISGSGDINITAKTLKFNHQGTIVNNVATGNAGNINIDVDYLLSEEGGLISTATFGIGHSGDINITANKLLSVIESKNQYQYPARISAGSISHQENAGNAGDISINAARIYVADYGSGISATANNAEGGNITLNVEKWLFLENGGEVTTTVKGGEQNSGNITISNPLFFIANQGNVIAQAVQGRGGNIDIQAEHLLSNNNTQISASSHLGLDGTVNIEDPEESSNTHFLVLSGDFLTQEGVELVNCNIKSLNELNQLFVNLSYEGKPRSTQDFQE